MKTQIITLASHDDLISVRDRMSWAKSARILLVWPEYEQVPLRPLDLRILQQHAAELGAQIGLVTRRGEVKRDAESFGIPVFRSTAEAQRGPWPGSSSGAWRRPRRTRNRIAELRATHQQLRSSGEHWSSRPGARIGFFVLAVLAVFSIASLFVPRATVVLTPITMEQKATIAIDISGVGAPGILSGRVPAQTPRITISGKKTMRVESQSEIPKEKATGTVRFQNLAQSMTVIPSGTIVYSVTPSTVRFATLQEARLDGKVNASVEVPIEALEAGRIGNVPANGIQVIEGSLGASTTVTNPEPTEGGVNAVEAVPSPSDRDRLRASLLNELEAEAESQMTALLKEDDVVLPNTLTLVSIDQESFDPPAGQPGSVLSLAMSATYRVTYVSGADLRRLAEVTLNASMPTEYMPRAGTLRFSLTAASTSDGNGEPRFNLETGRTIMREVDVDTANLLIRGRMPKQALGELQSTLPLAAPPEIRVTPRWWPWLPLIPFRIAVVVV